MSERGFYVLAYDIANDRRRAKIARALEAQAERVQESVFEAYLTQNELEKLLRKSLKWMKLEEDSLRIYPLCQACRGKARAVGAGRVTEPPGVVIV